MCYNKNIESLVKSNKKNTNSLYEKGLNNE